jgi:hypothetical protein
VKQEFLMTARHPLRRFAALIFAMALFALSANAIFADTTDPSLDPIGIIVIGG